MCINKRGADGNVGIIGKSINYLLYANDTELNPNSREKTASFGA